MGEQGCSEQNRSQEPHAHRVTVTTIISGTVERPCPLAHSGCCRGRDGDPRTASRAGSEPSARSSTVPHPTAGQWASPPTGCLGTVGRRGRCRAPIRRPTGSHSQNVQGTHTQWVKANTHTTRGLTNLQRLHGRRQRPTGRSPAATGAPQHRPHKHTQDTQPQGGYCRYKRRAHTGMFGK
jgi:hypothetical protein